MTMTITIEPEAKQEVKKGLIEILQDQRRLLCEVEDLAAARNKWNTTCRVIRK
jgi:hypothetical protein